MNVASLELCKELYELSDWNDELPMHYDATDGLVSIGIPRKALSGNVDIPVYDLGYLLRKLPTGITHPAHEAEVLWLEINKWAEGYQALYELNDDGAASKLSFIADTPEDAACQLAIELFKQGILTKDRAE